MVPIRLMVATEISPSSCTWGLFHQKLRSRSWCVLVSLYSILASILTHWKNTLFRDVYGYGLTLFWIPSSPAELLKPGMLCLHINTVLQCRYWRVCLRTCEMFATVCVKFHSYDTHSLWWYWNAGCEQLKKTENEQFELKFHTPLSPYQKLL